MAYYIDAEHVDLAGVRARIEATDLVPSRAPLRDGMEAAMSMLGAHGVTTLAQLRVELRTAKRLGVVAQATGIDLQYLTLLRREIESWFPKPYALSEFDWLPKSEVAKLEQSGIRDTAALHDRAGSAGEWRELAESVGTSESFLESLARLADLTRVQWVSPTTARMLVEASCDGASALAAADAESLYDELARVNREGQFFKGKIGLRDVRRLVRAAGYVAE